MIRRLLITFIFLLALPEAAFSQDVILMVNMNYSSEELKALEEVAAARGQRVEMVPPRDLISTAEPMFLKKYALEAALAKSIGGGAAPTEQQNLRIRKAMAGITREGSAWNGDPELTAIMGSARMNEIFSAAQKVFAAEQRNGDLVDQLKRKAAELKAKGERVDSIAFSSHSDGSNLTGESTLRLSANELTRLRQEAPNLFDNARHVLLLGCYNMTKPNHRAWRYDLFPNSSMLAGFGIKAPSRFDQKSSNFIRQTMAAADKLDREMVQAGRALDPRYLDSVWKSLRTFTTTSHPGVIDYCGAMSEGQPETYTRDCDTQWADLREKRYKMQKYWDLWAPQEDPPTVGGGELRIFYNVLQAACPAAETPTERDDPRGAERLRVTLREHTIRLIFWWNVQGNFSTYYKNEIAAMNARLRAAGVWEGMPKLDGTTSRVQFVGAFNNVLQQLERNPGLKSEFERLYGPLYYLKGEDTVMQGEKLSIEATLARGAIPFNWIEGSTVMRRR